MDKYSNHINEMNDFLHSFEKNNRILSDNWKDDQAEKFSQSILNEITTISKNLVQLIEEGKIGIGTLAQQIEDMEKELDHLKSSWPSS